MNWVLLSGLAIVVISTACGGSDASDVRIDDPSAGGSRAGGSGAAGSSNANSSGGASGSGGMAPANWFCSQQDDACICVASTSSTQDTCALPKPACCFTYQFGADSCSCFPYVGADCTNLVQGLNGTLVSACPPAK